MGNTRIAALNDQLKAATASQDNLFGRRSDEAGSESDDGAGQTQKAVGQRASELSLILF
jgi:hypothetical protein